MQPNARPIPCASSPVSRAAQAANNSDDLTRLDDQAGGINYRFMVIAEVAPGLLPRVIQLVAKRGMAPTMFYATQKQTSAGLDCHLSMEVVGLEPVTAEMIGESIRQLPGIFEVTMTVGKADLGPCPG